ncbi:FtsX-like permease family protein [Lactobacillus pentosus]|jgi:putative ABC transport system permease protein|uniref:ABC transporter permease n=1 Tax=Lactiplantibacillus pentosus TaxID=1589 RepID=A0A2S9W8H9_LACPE|nr:MULTISPECIES: ABC transporter permease [Lactiplantibacillus]MCH4129747.1 ABC transporter permease [Lactiplantibacillus sp.]BBM22592.1 ABC superfamily ATP binding cassette transporter, permease [Lactiplantibacillus plantarum]MBO9164830.1 FtsX-like permease family protein [Lactiplantibacillus pentosus]MBU7474075.1 FtsX-like permease family protein [Lactiplantibacillus pentosus]MBU7529303.1 FtsX-like permease family protein [Lactiplantibacillus pentosus]
MLTKLAMTGFKHRWRDYLVLFSGLIMSSAIFYMFEALATNNAFLKQNTSIGMVGFIFQFGSVLLTIITLVYIGYANSFLLSMRKRDYGLFMMVGARKSKIGQLIWLETLLVGVTATIVGILVGTALTAGVSQILINSLGLTLHRFAAWYAPAALVTILLYVGLFLIAGVFNLIALTRTPALKLLHSNDQPNRPQLKPMRQLLEVIVGLISIAIGYWAMANLETLVLAGIGIALVTIVLGTYLLFNAIFVWLMVALKRFKFAQRGLNGFTLSQLSFRIRNYTKMLSIVAMLFALALGAITVGMGFHSQIPLMANANNAYDMGLVNTTKSERQQIAAMKPKTTHTYHFKATKKVTYYRAAEFNQQPFTTIKMQNKHQLDYRPVQNNAAKLQKSFDNYQLTQLQGGTMAATTPVFLSETAYAKLAQPEQRLTVFTTNSVLEHRSALAKLAKEHFHTTNPEQYGGRYAMYQLVNSMYSGLEFMGMFLGIAFLAMLASCLMFKILSGAAADQHRYAMLDKVGTTRRQLTGAINKEIAVLFILPGIVGIVHVLFGLQMFKIIMVTSPYTGIWLPFLIFAGLYLLYYLMTITIYRRIVLE